MTEEQTTVHTAQGLESIFTRILADAAEQVQQIAQDAEHQIMQVQADTEKKIRGIRTEMDRKIATQTDAILSRTDATVTQSRRSAVQQAKSALLEDTFQKAEQAILAMPASEKQSFLTKLLAEALRACDQNQTEPLVLALPEADAELADTLISAAEKTSPRKILLCETPLSASFGLTLTDGDVIMDGTLPLLMAQYREAHESEISAILFAEKE